MTVLAFGVREDNWDSHLNGEKPAISEFAGKHAYCREGPPSTKTLKES